MMRVATSIFLCMALASVPACYSSDHYTSDSQQIAKLMKAHQYYEALTIAVSCAKKYPKDPVHLRDLGDCEMRIGRLPDAISHLTKSIQLKSDDWMAYNLRYHAYIELDEYKKALIDCRKCIKLQPKFAKGHRDIVTLCNKLPGDPDAKLVLANLKIYDPVEAAKALMKDSNFKGAIALLDKELKAPVPVAQKVRLLQTRRKCFFYTGEHTKNLADLNELIRLDPNPTAYIYLQRANAESNLKMYSDSARDLTKVISMHPTAKQIHLTTDELFYRRAFCYIELKDYQKAIADLDTLLKIDSEQEEVYKLRGECYSNLGQYQRALDDFAKAIKHDSESSGSSYYARALVYEKMGKKLEAAADKKRALELGYLPKSEKQAQGKKGNTASEDVFDKR